MTGVKLTVGSVLGAPHLKGHLVAFEYTSVVRQLYSLLHLFVVFFHVPYLPQPCLLPR